MRLTVSTRAAALAARHVGASSAAAATSGRSAITALLCPRSSSHAAVFAAARHARQYQQQQQQSRSTARLYSTQQPTPPPPRPGSSSSSQGKNQPNPSDPQQPNAGDEDAPLRRPSGFNLDTTLAPFLLGAGKGGKGGDGGEGGDGGNGGQQAKRPTAEQTGRGVLKYMWLVLVGAGAYGVYRFGQPLDEAEQLLFKDNPLADSWFGRLRLRTFSLQSELSGPASNVLLPAQDPRIQRPYTLVVELDDLLVHSEWDRQRGWRVAKRPGLDYFLGYLSTFFEIIVFTSAPQFGSEPILVKLDQDGRYIFQRLYKEHCRLVDGELVKDLSYLNRDLSKTIILDTNRSRFALQPENGFEVKAWNGDPNDRELVKWIQLLESVFIWNFSDVRQFIASYKDVEDIPAEHKRRLDEYRKSELSQIEAATKQRRRFGLGGTSLTGQAPRREAKTFYDSQSELYHKMYIEDEAHWQKIKDDWRKQNEDLDAMRWEKFVAEHGQPSALDMIQVQLGMKPPFELPDVSMEELEASKKKKAEEGAAAATTSSAPAGASAPASA
ncbi:hypothetical protein V8E36_002047 [Tilletia maclaganii]